MKTDQRIIELIRKKDPEGTDLLFQTHSAVVYGFLLRQVNDLQKTGALLQKVFVEAEHKIQQAVVTEIRLSLWLLAIAREQATSSSKQVAALTQLQQAVHEAGGRPEDVCKQREVAMLLVSTLHEKSCSAAQVAEMLGWTVTEVGQTVRQALLRIYSSELT